MLKRFKNQFFLYEAIKIDFLNIYIKTRIQDKSY